MNIWDIVAVALIIAGTALAVRQIRKNKQAGCTGCCASCGHVCGHPPREKENA